MSFTAGSTGGEYKHKLSIPEIPSHTHTQYVGANSGNWGSRHDHNGDSNCQSYPQGNTSYTGGSGSHNNISPYYAVYIWERTA